MILALIYIGLMLMLGARLLYVHLNETFLFKSIGGLDVPIILCDDFYYDLGYCPYPIRFGILSLEYPRLLMILES